MCSSDLRRATQIRKYETWAAEISTHALREEGDLMKEAGYKYNGNFYPRPP